MVLCQKLTGPLQGVFRSGLPLGVQLDPGSQGVLAKTREQTTEVRGVLRRDGIDFHAEAAAILRNVADFRFGANLAFLDEKMKAHEFALFFAGPGFEEKARGTKVAHAGNVPIWRRFPVDPYIFDRGNARRASSGGPGYWIRSTHRVHP